MQFRNVVRRIFKLQNCQRVGRVLLPCQPASLVEFSRDSIFSHSFFPQFTSTGIFSLPLIKGFFSPIFFCPGYFSCNQLNPKKTRLDELPSQKPKRRKCRRYYFPSRLVVCIVMQTRTYVLHVLYSISYV